MQDFTGRGLRMLVWVQFLLNRKRGFAWVHFVGWIVQAERPGGGLRESLFEFKLLCTVGEDSAARVICIVTLFGGKSWSRILNAFFELKFSWTGARFGRGDLFVEWIVQAGRPGQSYECLFKLLKLSWTASRVLPALTLQDESLRRKGLVGNHECLFEFKFVWTVGKVSLVCITYHESFMRAGLVENYKCNMGDISSAGYLCCFKM